MARFLFILQAINSVSALTQPTLSGARIFHPAFPTFVSKPLSNDEVSEILNVKRALNADQSSSDFTGLPWQTFPDIGVSDQPNVWSKSQILDAYDRSRHRGHIIW
jgi:hypothetical protein